MLLPLLVTSILGAASVDIAVDGIPLRFDLQPHSLRADGFRARATRDGREWIDVGAHPPAIVRGQAAGDPSTWFSGTSSAAGPRGLIHRIGGPDWAVEPAERAGELVRAQRLDERALAALQQAVCGVVDSVQPGAQGVVPDLSAITLGRSAQIALAGDGEWWQEQLCLGVPADQIDDEMEALLDAAALVFELEVGLHFELTEIALWTDPATDPFSASTDWNGYLAHVRDSFNVNPWLSAPRDVLQFFTGKSMDGSTIGLAYIGGLCTPNAYSVVESNWSACGGAACCAAPAFALRAALCAHELGHNCGANHCDGQADCGVMCSLIGGCTGITSSFGASARAAISAKLAQVTCLTPHSADLTTCSAGGLGGGVGAGSSAPKLSEKGALLGGKIGTLSYTGGPSSALGALVLGTSNPALPLLGGTLGASLDYLKPLQTYSSGSWSYGYLWPAGVAHDQAMYAQLWAIDAAAPQGVSASNALALMPPLLDGFAGLDGAPPDPSAWSIAGACAVDGSALASLQAQRLRLWRLEGGACGAPIATRGTVAVRQFDFALRLMDVASNAVAHAGFGMESAAVLVGGAQQDWATIRWEGLPGSGTLIVRWGAAQELVTAEPYQLYDTLRISGVPGGALRFWRNGVVFHSVDPWLPAQTSFVARLWAGALAGAGSAGAWTQIEWDDCVLCATP